MDPNDVSAERQPDYETVPDAARTHFRPSPSWRVRSLPATLSSCEPQSRLRWSLRLECPSPRLAFKEVVAGQGRCPWWPSRASPSSAALRPPVTPKSPVGFLLGSSGELPLASVRAGPLVDSKVSGVTCRGENTSEAQESCKLFRLVPDFLVSGRDPSKIE